MKTDFMKCRERLEFCNTIRKLQNAWTEITPMLKTMDKGSRLALVAMKDYYKKLIQGGQIEDYLHSRRVAKSKDWSDPEVQKQASEDMRRLVRQQGGMEKVGISKGRGTARGNKRPGKTSHIRYKS